MRKIFLIGIVAFVVTGVGLIGVLGWVAISDLIDTQQTLAEPPKPTRSPTNTPVRPVPTKAYNRSSQSGECKTLADFGQAIEVGIGMKPNFQTSDIGIWDYEWRIEEALGVYGVTVTEENGCLQKAGIMTVFDIELGSPEITGDMIGATAGFFSPESNGMDWVSNEMTGECATASGHYVNTKKMNDGTSWEIHCEWEGSILSLGLSIYPQ